MLQTLLCHLPARRLYAVHRYLLRTALRGLGFNNWQSMEQSGENWAIQRLLPSLIKKPNPLMLDIGAHQGEYSHELLKVYPDATIHAFEPHPRTFGLLQSKADSRLKLHAAAMGAAAGEAELYDRKGNDGSVHASLSQDAVRTIYQDDVIVHRVKVITLDEFMTENGIASIDFLKIDTEGFEMDVLNGAEAALAGGKIGIIQFEFNSMHVGRHQFLEDFTRRLEGHRLYRLLKDGMVALDRLKVVEREIFAFQNIVAIPKAMAPAKA
jgi:FkbM family methyltransferase